MMAHACPTWPLLRSALRRALAIVCLLGLCAAPAWAAAASGAEHEKEALALAAQARNHYRDKDFATAADLYMQAYAHTPEPTLLFNAARSYEEASKLREALPLFHLYLSLNQGTDPDAVAGRADAQSHVAEIQNKLKAQDASAAQVAPPLPDKPPVLAETPADARPVPTEPVVRPPVHRAGMFERVRHPDSGWSTQRKVAVATGAAGAAAILAGAVVALVASGDLDAIEGDAQRHGSVVLHPGVTQVQADAAYTSHASHQAWAGALIGIGAVGVGTALVLWWLEPESPKRSVAQWPTLMICDGGAVASVHLSF